MNYFPIYLINILKDTYHISSDSLSKGRIQNRTFWLALEKKEFCNLFYFVPFTPQPHPTPHYTFNWKPFKTDKISC